MLTNYHYGDKEFDEATVLLMTEINTFFANKNLNNKLKNLFEKAKKRSLITIKSFPITE